MMISKDSNVSFWKGNWLNKGPLRNLIQRPLPQGASQLEVKDVLIYTGGIGAKFLLSCPWMLNP